MIMIKMLVIIVVSLLAGWIVGTIEYFTQSPDFGARFAVAIIVVFLLCVIMRKKK